MINTTLNMGKPGRTTGSTQKTPQELLKVGKLAHEAKKNKGQRVGDVAQAVNWSGPTVAKARRFYEEHLAELSRKAIEAKQAQIVKSYTTCLGANGTGSATETPAESRQGLPRMETGLRIEDIGLHSEDTKKKVESEDISLDLKSNNEELKLDLIKCAAKHPEKAEVFLEMLKQLK